jgi:hypothetical protein
VDGAVAPDDDRLQLLEDRDHFITKVIFHHLRLALEGLRGVVEVAVVVGAVDFYGA